MAITQEFNLNMIPDSAPVVVHVNQYDEGEDRLVIHLLDGMVPYVPSTGAEAIIQGTKPDGKGFDYNATLSGSTVTANVTKQMTAVCGSVRTQVVITEGDNITGTFVFDLVVQKSGLPADTDMSASEYQIVEQMIEAAEEAEAISTQSAEDSEAWATGKRSGQDVPSTDPTYHNNSKYWADKAHEELNNKADLVDGKVPSSQLPSYVDDVIEGYYNSLDRKFYKESTYETEIEGEEGKIYVDLATDKSYRWSGSAFVLINDPDIAENTLNSITTSTATYPEFSVGETLKVIFGKIKKFLSDLHDKKSDKVTSATANNLAALDSNGNLTDSGKSKSATIPSGGTTGQVLKKKSGTNYDTEWGALATSKGSATKGVYFDANGAVQEMSYTVGKSVPSNAVFTDTKNTAGSTDSSSKLFLIGATSQAANPQTYSQDNAYVGTDGNLYSGSKVVATQNMIGDAWVTSHAYTVGDYCIDGNVLYKCKTAHTSSASYRPPYASYWDAVSVTSQLDRGGVRETLLDTGLINIKQSQYEQSTYTRYLYSSSKSASHQKSYYIDRYKYIRGYLIGSANGNASSVGFIEVDTDLISSYPTLNVIATYEVTKMQGLTQCISGQWTINSQQQEFVYLTLSTLDQIYDSLRYVVIGELR